jgi:hypothetical protein
MSVDKTTRQHSDRASFVTKSRHDELQCRFVVACWPCLRGNCDYRHMMVSEGAQTRLPIAAASIFKSFWAPLPRKRYIVLPSFIITLFSRGVMRQDRKEAKRSFTRTNKKIATQSLTKKTCW